MHRRRHRKNNRQTPRANEKISFTKKRSNINARLSLFLSVVKKDAMEDAMDLDATPSATSSSTSSLPVTCFLWSGGAIEQGCSRVLTQRASHYLHLAPHHQQWTELKRGGQCMDKRSVGRAEARAGIPRTAATIALTRGEVDMTWLRFRPQRRDGTLSKAAGPRLSWCGPPLRSLWTHARVLGPNLCA